MLTAPGVPMLDSKLFVTRTDGAFRNLFERWWDGEEWVWVDHGRPGGIPVTGAPGAGMLASKLFVVIQDGRLFERVWTGAQWVWTGPDRGGSLVNDVLEEMRDPVQPHGLLHRPDPDPQVGGNPGRAPVLAEQDREAVVEHVLLDVEPGGYGVRRIDGGCNGSWLRRLSAGPG